MSRGGILGGDICAMGLQPDIVNMTCSVRYSGNVAPSLSWTHDSSADVLLNVTNFTLQSDETSVTVCTLIVSGREDMNGSRFHCSAQMIWNKSGATTTTDLPLNWTSDKLNVLCNAYCMMYI